MSPSQALAHELSAVSSDVWHRWVAAALAHAGETPVVRKVIDRHWQVVRGEQPNGVYDWRWLDWEIEKALPRSTRYNPFPRWTDDDRLVKAAQLSCVAGPPNIERLNDLVCTLVQVRYGAAYDACSKAWSAGYDTYLEAKGKWSVLYDKAHMYPADPTVHPGPPPIEPLVPSEEQTAAYCKKVAAEYLGYITESLARLLREEVSTA